MDGRKVWKSRVCDARIGASILSESKTTARFGSFSLISNQTNPSKSAVIFVIASRSQMSPTASASTRAPVCFVNRKLFSRMVCVSAPMAALRRMGAARSSSPALEMLSGNTLDPHVIVRPHVLICLSAVVMGVQGFTTRLASTPVFAEIQGGSARWLNAACPWASS